MPKINSKQKGARGEREWAKFLNDFGIEARRGVQYQGSYDSPDVKTELDDKIHFEVKRMETFNAYRAMNQAVKDATGSKAIPVVAHRANTKEWLIVLRAEDFVKKIIKDKLFS